MISIKISKIIFMLKIFQHNLLDMLKIIYCSLIQFNLEHGILLWGISVLLLQKLFEISHALFFIHIQKLTTQHQ